MNLLSKQNIEPNMINEEEKEKKRKSLFPNWDRRHCLIISRSVLKSKRILSKRNTSMPNLF